MFSSALQSGQLAPLMGQFGFNEDVMGAASRGGMWRELVWNQRRIIRICFFFLVFDENGFYKSKEGS